MPMKKSVSFTSDQFRTLLELVYLGEQMVNGHKVDRVKRHEELFSYLFSLASQFNLADVSLPEEAQFPTASFEEEMSENYISEYDELTFWHELSDRLTYKTIQQRYTSEQVDAMTKEEWFISLCRISDEIDAYLETHGLDHISLPVD